MLYTKYRSNNFKNKNLWTFIDVKCLRHRINSTFQYLKRNFVIIFFNRNHNVGDSRIKLELVDKMLKNVTHVQSIW